jgi:hypothetical protein
MGWNPFKAVGNYFANLGEVIVSAILTLIELVVMGIVGIIMAVLFMAINYTPNLTSRHLVPGLGNGQDIMGVTMGTGAPPTIVHDLAGVNALESIYSLSTTIAFGLLSVSIVGVGLMFTVGWIPNLRMAAKESLGRIVLFGALAFFAKDIFQLILDLSTMVSSGILSGAQARDMWAEISIDILSSAGAGVVDAGSGLVNGDMGTNTNPLMAQVGMIFGGFILAFAMLAVLLEICIRFGVILFIGSISPIVMVSFAFPWTRSFASKSFKLFVGAAFLNIFTLIGLKLTLLTMVALNDPTNTGYDKSAVPFIMAGMGAIIAYIPKLLLDMSGAISAGSGTIKAGSMAAVTSVAAAGAMVGGAAAGGMAAASKGAAGAAPKGFNAAMTKMQSGMSNIRKTAGQSLAKQAKQATGLGGISKNSEDDVTSKGKGGKDDSDLRVNAGGGGDLGGGGGKGGGKGGDKADGGAKGDKAGKGDAALNQTGKAAAKPAAPAPANQASIDSATKAQTGFKAAMADAPSAREGMSSGDLAAAKEKDMAAIKGSPDFAVDGPAKLAATQKAYSQLQGGVSDDPLVKDTLQAPKVPAPQAPVDQKAKDLNTIGGGKAPAKAPATKSALKEQAGAAREALGDFGPHNMQDHHELNAAEERLGSEMPDEGGQATAGRPAKPSAQQSAAARKALGLGANPNAKQIRKAVDKKAAAVQKLEKTDRAQAMAQSCELEDAVDTLDAEVRSNPIAGANAEDLSQEMTVAVARGYEPGDMHKRVNGSKSNVAQSAYSQMAGDLRATNSALGQASAESGIRNLGDYRAATPRQRSQARAALQQHNPSPQVMKTLNTFDAAKGYQVEGAQVSEGRRAFVQPTKAQLDGALDNSFERANGTLNGASESFMEGSGGAQPSPRPPPAEAAASSGEPSFEEAGDDGPKPPPGPSAPSPGRRPPPAPPRQVRPWSSSSAAIMKKYNIGDTRRSNFGGAAATIRKQSLHARQIAQDEAAHRQMEADLAALESDYNAGAGDE